MHESPYNVNIKCCSVQDVHEQPEWPSASYRAACILLNHLVDNVYFVFGFITMINDFSYKKCGIKQSNAAEIFAKNSGGLQNVPHLTCEGFAGAICILRQLSRHQFSFEIPLVVLGQHLKEPLAVPEKPSIFCICKASVTPTGTYLKKQKLLLPKSGSLFLSTHY
ncbi:hypothetical protein T02_8864 [Trichinella nativa]|uniref:Uncharacterized protein n=1 Tax=Trichinella nativa TaxID=6335 RepID=A0A0V1L9V1_9BILA|nr:hypothetical protein T02_8864 [Trichinella nativa]